MITGDLPPSSSVTLARCLAAAAITILPTRVLPVKKMWLNGSSSSAVATLTSPSNSATSFSSNTSRMITPAIFAVAGQRSVSLTMQVLPAATAAATGPSVEAEREVPRAEHRAHAARLIGDQRLVRRVLRRGDLGRLHPFVEAVDRQLDVAGDVEHFGDADFTFGLAGVLAHGGDDIVGPESTAAFSFSSFALRVSALVALTSH